MNPVVIPGGESTALIHQPEGSAVHVMGCVGTDGTWISLAVAADLFCADLASDLPEAGTIRVVGLPEMDFAQGTTLVLG